MTLTSTHPFGVLADTHRGLSGDPPWHLVVLHGVLDLGTVPALVDLFAGFADDHPAGGGVVVDLSYGSSDIVERPDEPFECRPAS